MNFNQSYTKVQYSMDTSLLKNRREFAKQMYLEGMSSAMAILEEARKTPGLSSPTQVLLFDAERLIRDAIAEESK